MINLNHLNRYLSYIVFAILLNGCMHYEIKADNSDVNRTYYSDAYPQIVLFKLTDSYGTQHIVRALSTVNKGPMRLNRLIDNGRFSLDWNVRYRGDYIVELLLSNEKSTLISPITGIACLAENNCIKKTRRILCRYYSELKILCGERDRGRSLFYLNKNHAHENIYPQKMIMILRACDMNRIKCNQKEIKIILE